jgi:hypothetical protein
MRAPAELDDSNRGHCSPPDPLLSNFVIQSTIYFAPPATHRNSSQRNKLFDPSPRRRAVHCFLTAPCIYLGMAVACISRWVRT